MGASGVRRPLAGLGVCTSLGDAVTRGLLACICPCGRRARGLQAKLALLLFPGLHAHPIAPRRKNLYPTPGAWSLLEERFPRTGELAIRAGAEVSLPRPQEDASTLPHRGFQPPEFATHAQVYGFHLSSHPARHCGTFSSTPCSLPPLDFPFRMQTWVSMCHCKQLSASQFHPSVPKSGPSPHPDI